MSQYRVTLRGMLPIETEVLVEGDTIAEAKANALYFETWLIDPKVYVEDSGNEIDCWSTDIEGVELTLTDDKVRKILKSEEVSK